MFLKLCADVAASAFQNGQQNGKDHKLSMSSKSCVFLRIRSGELSVVVDEFQSGTTVQSLDDGTKEKSFYVAFFFFSLSLSSDRIFSFFVLLPGMAAVTVIS